MKKKSQQKNHNTIHQITHLHHSNLNVADSPLTKKSNLLFQQPNHNHHLTKSPFTLYVEQQLSPLPCPPQIKKSRAPQMMIYQTPEKHLHTFNFANLSRISEPLNFDAFNFSSKKRDIHLQEDMDDDLQNQTSKNQLQTQEKQKEKNQKSQINSISKKSHQEEENHASNQIIGDQKKLCCNCKKSRCLKLYCDCFSLNKFCQGCNCVACLNKAQYESQRYNAMVNLIQRNPQAFKPKIEIQKHTKGCNCKKSNCLKKYCECFQGGLQCSDLCKCQQCKNTVSKQQTSNKLKLKSTIKKQGRYIQWENITSIK